MSYGSHRMPRRLAIAAVVAALGLTLAGCGGSTTPTTTPATAAGSPPAVATQTDGPISDADTTGSQLRTAADCPTSNTKAFAKTRFVLNSGLALGAFHRYLYKPYKSGAFSKGQKGRVSASIKAAGATGFIVWRLNHAKNDAAANPTLCRAIVAPVNQLVASIKGLKSRLLTGGDVSSALNGDESLFNTFQQQATRQGDKFLEKDASDLTSTQQ